MSDDNPFEKAWPPRDDDEDDHDWLREAPAEDDVDPATVYIVDWCTTCGDTRIIQR